MQCYFKDCNVEAAFVGTVRTLGGQPMEVKTCLLHSFDSRLDQPQVEPIRNKVELLASPKPGEDWVVWSQIGGRLAVYQPQLVKS